MGNLSNEETLRSTIELISFHVDDIVMQEVKAYSYAHPDNIVSLATIGVITQRAVSELMLRASNFRAPEANDKDELKAAFDKWFEENEVETLRRICRNSLTEEFKPKDDESDDKLTFTEKYLKKIREEQQQRKR